MDDGTRQRCSGTNLDGGPCSGYRQPSSPYCVFHDPARRAAVEAGRVKGGKGKTNAARARKDLPPAMTPAELQRVLSGTLRGVLSGRIAPNVANACAALGRTLIVIREATETEERLAALEAAAAAEQPTKRWGA